MRRIRKATGNMMAMMISTMIVMAALICFGLWYTQHSLTTTEHRSSIDSAALAAAAAISRIVVRSDDVGWVSLTGNAPIGTNMKAPDNWFQRVHSINELMGANRVDYIIADELGDNFLMAMAKHDHDAILAAKDTLMTEINKAILPGGFSYDIDGNQVKPYDDALSLYLSNPTLASSFVPNSLTLKYGNVENGIVTAIRVPNPISKAAVGASDYVDGKYRSNRNIPFKGRDYVFAPVGDQIALASHNKFVASVPGLPYQMPGAIEVSAQQKFVEQGKTAVVPYSSVATCGGVFVAPADGQFRVSFPDGQPNEIKGMDDLWKWGQLKGKPAAVYTSVNGDYPTDAGATLTPTLTWDPLPTSKPPTCDEIGKLLFWDWLRNGGSRVNIDSVVAAVKMNFNTVNPPKEMWVSKDAGGKLVAVDNVPVGVVHEFDFNRNGDVHYVWKRVTPEPYYPVSEGQMYAESTDLSSGTAGWNADLAVLLDGVSKDIKPKNKYDVYYRDFVRQRGGPDGKHVGEPLAYDNDKGTGGQAAGVYTGVFGKGLPPTVSEQTDFALSSVPAPRYKNFTYGPASGAPRPTFTMDGVCCEIRFRRQLDISDLLDPVTMTTGVPSTGYKGQTWDPALGGGLPVPPRGGAGSGAKGSKAGKKGGGRGGGGSGGSGGGGSGAGRGGGGNGGS